MAQWLAMVIFVTLIEFVVPQPSSLDESEEYPLIKFLGYSIKSRVGKTLDARLSQEFIDKYHEIRQASQESFESFEKKNEKRLRRVIGDDELDVIKEASRLQRRRNPNKLQSAVGRRRVRSQEIRRNKLNSQSLRSHMHYSQQTNLDYSND